MEQKGIIDNMECKIKILVCYYQPWEIIHDDLFFPIQAGKSVSGFDLKIQGDDTGDNISSKNAVFGEFTAWYWAWKNIKNYYPNLEYIGLSHYRRFFCMNNRFWEKREINVLNLPPMFNYEKLLINTLRKNDIILIRPEKQEYNIRTQYSYWHNSFDYLILRNTVREMYPEYYESFLYFFEKNKSISWYCMFVSKYEFLDNYFKWLFPLLSKLEQKIDVSSYSDYQKRVLAFLAERLLNVYVLHHNLKIKYKPIYFICKDDAEIKKKTKKNNGIFKITKAVKSFIPYEIIKLWKKIKNKDYHIILRKKLHDKCAVLS